MEVGEFIDTYSDDVLYLSESRAALLTHPLMPALKDPTDASACRLLAVFMVGSTEVMLETWRERDGMDILSVYFADKRQNGEKVSALFEAFRQAGIEVNRDVFDDYLAIKYLRNTIIHGRWKEHEKEWVESRGFPGDTRKLTEKHFNKIGDVNQNMMFYISLTGYMNNKLPTTYTPKPLAAPRHDVTGIIKVRDLDRILWSNLERIHSHLGDAIAATVTTAEYDWTDGLSRSEIESLAHNERKRLYYLAARRAGEEDCPQLAQHRSLAREALAFWDEYWHRAIATHGLDEDCISQAILAMTDAEPWLKNASTLVKSGIHTDDAVQLGRLAYEKLPNVSALSLLSLALPIVDPANTGAYVEAARRAWNAFILARAWYSMVEHRELFRVDKNLAFYRGIAREFGS